MDFDLPDREEVACALDTLEVRLARQGQYDGAADVASAHRLLRAADEEIDRLRTALAEAQRERDELRADRERLAYRVEMAIEAHFCCASCVRSWLTKDDGAIDRAIREARVS